MQLCKQNIIELLINQYKGNEGLTTPHKNDIVMKKETYPEDEWFFHFLNVFLTHAYYWVIIALLIKWIIVHG